MTGIMRQSVLYHWDSVLSIYSEIFYDKVRRSLKIDHEQYDLLPAQQNSLYPRRIQYTDTILRGCTEMLDTYIQLVSLTYTQKAQRLLNAENIRSTIVRVDGSRKHRGCEYVLAVSDHELRFIKLLLNKAGVRIVDIF